MLDDILFYWLDKAIKQYRQFAQANLNEAGYSITVDQWLVLKVIQESPELGQAEIAERVFKDQASVARIIELLISKNLIQQQVSQTDRRRADRSLTQAGEVLLQAVAPIITSNRATALQHLSTEDINHLRQSMETIFKNCQRK